MDHISNNSSGSSQEEPINKELQSIKMRVTKDVLKKNLKLEVKTSKKFTEEFASKTVGGSKRRLVAFTKPASNS